MSITLDAIRDSLDGVIPSVIATCAPDGTPNVTYISHVDYVDPRHVALSFQFFNKTRANVLENPRAAVIVVDPVTLALYRLALEYLRTETSGPLFERMKARLASIAAHSGMSDVFRLLGSDVYRVLAIERVPGAVAPAPAPRRSLLAALRSAAQRLAACSDLAALLDETLTCLETLFDIPHAVVLLHDAGTGRLFTVASRGYRESGVGSEIALGDGVIGVAARERTPIRLNYETNDVVYSHAVRASETEIALPALEAPRSRLAVPILVGTTLLGVLYVESPQDVRFTYDDEDALLVLAEQLGRTMFAVQQSVEQQGEPLAGETRKSPARGAPAVIRYYAVNGSIFVDDDYLIKGVAGAIFWRLVRDYVHAQRTEFTNRELRLDASLRLPELGDNLEARLILLERRLAERCPFVRIEKIGRGRFRLAVERPLSLVETPAGAAA